jgi:hypothetical protein
MADHANPTMRCNLVAIDVARNWNAVLVVTAEGSTGFGWRIRSSTSALPTVGVDDGQRTEPTPVEQRVGHEIHTSTTSRHVPFLQGIFSIMPEIPVRNPGLALRIATIQTTAPAPQAPVTTPPRRAPRQSPDEPSMTV